jgi:hypothetical protein
MGLRILIPKCGQNMALFLVVLLIIDFYVEKAYLA